MRRFIVTALLAAIVGCGSDSTSPASVNVVGVFQLKTINGTALPFVAQAANPKLEITSEQFSLNADGTYSDVANFRITQGSSITTSSLATIGVYQSANGAVSFHQTSPSLATYSGTVNGNTLTYISSGGTFVYQR